MPLVTVIRREQLEDMLASRAPDNDDPGAGLALVNVLGEEEHRAEHIPRSINIPSHRLDEFERRFAKRKTIVVYCASSHCDASPRVAQTLVERGFENVFDYASGLSDWRAAGNAIERSA